MPTSHGGRAHTAPQPRTCADRARISKNLADLALTKALASPLGAIPPLINTPFLHQHPVRKRLSYTGHVGYSSYPFLSAEQVRQVREAYYPLWRELVGKTETASDDDH